MNFTKSPNRKEAHRILHGIAKKPATFTPRKVDKPLILYGAGNLGKMAKNYFEELGIPFLMVIDAKPDLHKQDPFWSGTEIFGIHDVIPAKLRKSTLLAVCIATQPFINISIPLKEQGWDDIVPFYDIAEAYHDQYPLHNGWYAGSLDERDVHGIESVLSRWQDDLSRAHHLQFIAWRSLREEWFFDNAPVTIHDRYFISHVLTVLHDHEIFVDIGAHHGEVSRKFLHTVKNRFREIYAIEPDKENFSQLYKLLEKCIFTTKEKIHLLSCALGSTTGSRRFRHGLGYASQFSESGQAEVEVKRLDDLSIPATCIKIHLEGWESDAISGGLETIFNNRPLLMVTSYHNRQGLWHLPAQLMSCLDNYRYYFRLHGWLGTGGVIYALPKERYWHDTA
ncbi:MAG: FkbM family methyltransferase [Clostridiales bacterium]|nr:FkbM family methyltransferase [Clostridiales bacterium]